MAEYIEREALYRKICELEELARNRYLDTPSNSPAYPRYMAQMNERTALKHLVFDMPAADVVPVVHGHWEFVNDYQSLCTYCDKESWVDHENEPNYCPNCGAKMDEAACMTADVLQMVYRINLHLFGSGEPVNGKEKSEPKCFRDVLQMEMEVLRNTREELSKLMDHLGCG